MENTNIWTNDYYSHLINQIIDQSDRAFLKAKKSEQESINITKNLLISTINDIQIPYLNGILQTCVFIPYPNSESQIKCINFKNKIGKLIIITDQINQSVLANLIEIYKNSYSSANFDYKTLEEAIQTSVIQKLIELKSIDCDPIVDITNVNENCLEKLTIDGKNSKFNEADFDVVPKLINTKKLNELNFLYQNINFQRIHPEMLTNLRHLTKLVLKCDHLDIIKTKNFSNLPNLEYLSITESNINKIEKNAFYGLVQLRSLILSSNELSELMAESFYGLDHLEYLIINQNKIESIEENTFECLVNLKFLELVENRIKLLSDRSFDGLFNLKILNLNNNKSNMRVNQQAFNSLMSLRVLDLASNTVEYLDPIAFEKLKNLRYLNLSNNLLQDWHFLNKLEKLEALNVMRMKQIGHKFGLINLKNLKFLKIEIESVPVFEESFGQLQALYLYGVTNFQENCFEKLKNLELIKIVAKKDSIIEKIDKDLLKPIKKIRFLLVQAEKFGDKSLEKFRQFEKKIMELFPRENCLSCETEIDDEKNILYTQITDCESEWIYLEEMLDVCDEVKKAILTSDISISHFESISSL